jgi:small subunit ribosomal protein S4
MNLELKNRRLEAEKCRGLDVRPGGHFRRGKPTPYGERFLEKQKLKWFYGVKERQFLRYFEEASRTKGNTGETLLAIFESRLDNVIFKLGWAPTRPQARQMIAHGHVNVGSRRCNIPSYRVLKDDVIQIRPGERSVRMARKSLEETKGRVLPSWIEVDPNELKGRILSLPAREDISLPINEQLIVEFLSR